MGRSDFPTIIILSNNLKKQGVNCLKVKFIKNLESILGKYLEGEVHDLEHDAYTIENWIDTGYCEAVEKVKAKLVKKDENKSSSDK